MINTRIRKLLYQSGLSSFFYFAGGASPFDSHTGFEMMQIQDQEVASDGFLFKNLFKIPFFILDKDRSVVILFFR